MYQDAQTIIQACLKDAMPGEAVCQALKKLPVGQGQLILIAVGKAAWEMARAAAKELRTRLTKGVVITKYGHSGGKLDRLEVYEAGHPVPDFNSYRATERALKMTTGLTDKDQVLFLISGGGSSLFEHPLIHPDELAQMTRELLKSGADIVEINTIRKRLSGVKGGKFALHCAPAQVYSIVLSDVIGDPLDMIASGPAYPDSSTCKDAMAIANRYQLSLSEQAQQLLMLETPKELSNVTTFVTGSVRQLCASAEIACLEMGYEPHFLTASLCCQARDAGLFLASIARDHQDSQQSIALLAGGETVVQIRGAGLGGRNQELALSAAEGIRGCRQTAVFSFGSDGTDGPTDAAGGYVDESTFDKLARSGVNVRQSLDQNDSYHALEAVGGLIKTGPTGTNVNDLSVVLIRR